MLCIRGTSRGPVSVCLSVSVTSGSFTRTAKRRITQTTPHDTPGSLVFWCQRSPRNSTGITPYEALNAGGGGQNRRLSTNIRLYLENGKRWTHSFYTVFQKKTRHQTLAHNFQMLTDFQNSFTGRLTGKFATNSYLNIPPHVKRVATLPCELSMFKKSQCSRSNWSKLPCKTSPTQKNCFKIFVWKNIP